MMCRWGRFYPKQGTMLQVVTILGLGGRLRRERFAIFAPWSQMTMTFIMRIKCFVTLIFLATCFAAAPKGAVRERANFDFDWRFTLADDSAFAARDFAGEAAWQAVQLPHDWNIGMAFDEKWGGSAAYLPESVGWYRKHFSVPASERGRRTDIVFDGIFHQSDVYVNGHHLGFRPYGFCSIGYDMTPYLHYGGDNVVAVRVDCTGGRPRWYAGSGIYRHAWLVTTEHVHVARYGTYVTTPEVDEAKATVKVVTSVENSGKELAEVTVTQRIVDAAGSTVALMPKTTVRVAAAGKEDVTQQAEVTRPQLWSMESQSLYKLVTTLKQSGRTEDVYTTSFGIRTLRFDADRGFFLNGRHVKLQGLCLHQDNGSLGTAVPDRAYERRLQILKAYGCNAIRCAHNQPSPELLDMCDRMGLLVIDEAFDKWKSGYYEKYFDRWWQTDMADMLLRDRNHPSVILWSIGNELQEAWNKDDEGVDRAAMLSDFVHKTEPTRPTVLAAQNNHQEKFAGVTDVVGYNYLEARAVSDHKKFPERRLLITEELPYYSGEEGNIRSYNTNNPWNIIAQNDFFAGGFIWSGVDYLGEAGWPSKGWPNGLFDVCMDEKPRAAFLRAMWNTKPVVRIAVMDQALDIDHGRDLWQWPRMAARWNFPQSYEGLVMEVRTVTNCQRVRLLVNGKVMGEQATADFPNHTVVWHVPYTPGSLEALGCNADSVVARHRLVTAGPAVRAVLTADRTAIRADGQDLAFISVQLTDKDGNAVPDDDRVISVSVKGQGRLLGLDTGELRREGSFATHEVRTYMGRALITVQAGRTPGVVGAVVKVDGMDGSCSIDIDSKTGI